MFNQAQWAGDYVAAGVVSIKADMANFGAAPLSMRIAIQGLGTQYGSTAAFALPADGQWYSLTFGLTASDLSLIIGLALLNDVLSNVDTLRILSVNGGPSWLGDTIVATFGTDNIQAVAPPPPPFPKLALKRISSGELVAPIQLTNAADGSGRLFVVDQRGKIQIIVNEALLPTPFLDIETKLVGQREGFDERGLLGLAFHPDYASGGAPGEGRFYLYYSAPQPNGDPADDINPVNHQSVIAEYKVSLGDPDVADASSERILLTFDQPQFNHDGGQLAFGPDGLLYISTGDGGGGNDNYAGHTGGSGHSGEPHPDGGIGNGQDRTNLLGNILRIDPLGNDGPGGQYGIPANPFVGAGGGIHEEIYAYGFRNPWRFSFDDGPGGNGDLFVADVGQRKFEEIDIVQWGGNYGWRIREGAHPFDPTVPDPGVALIEPIAEYSHPGVGEGQEIGRTVIGGFVYRGNDIPDLTGRYVFADWSTGFSAPGNGTLLGLDKVSAGTWELLVPEVASGNPIGIFITAMGEDESGELYVVAKSAVGPGMDPVSGQPGGVIYKIVLPIVGDVNGDCVVNILDMIFVRNNLGGDPDTDPGAAASDVNGDGRVNILDMISVRNELGNRC